MNKAINEHFIDYLYDWNSRFYFIMGGYGSSKSYNTAIKLIMKAVQEPNRKILVTRAYYSLLKESCFDLLKEIVYDLGLDHLFKFTTSPLGIKCVNGSRFIFAGLDDPAKLKSINGISIIWLEEAPEAKYDSFKELNGRLRTPNQSMHIIMTSNPVSKMSWTYKHYFEVRGIKDTKLYNERQFVFKDTYYHHSTVEDNVFAPADYIKQLDDIIEYDEDLHRVARLGEFGTIGERVLKRLELMDYKKGIEEIGRIKRPLYNAGMDFGFATSKNALVRTCVDRDKEYLYVYYEYYDNHKTDDITKEDIREFAESGELIYGDSAEPKTIAYYQQQGFNMYECTKFPGSRLQNIKKMQRFKKIIILDNCTNTWEELKDLVFKKDKNGNIIPDQFNIDPHSFSAMWYALDNYQVTDFKVYDI